MRCKKQPHLVARITAPELRAFLGTVNPDSILRRDDQNQVAHFLIVGMMAYHLQRCFRADPDGFTERVLQKVFVWLCSKNWEMAIEERDERVISHEGVGEVKPSTWEWVDGEESEFLEIV